MKTAEQMRIKTRKGIERITKRTFKKINNEIKEAARKGEYRCYVELWRNCDNNEKDRITQHYISKGYNVNFEMNDYIKIDWKKKNE